ncbi:MAG: SUF system Fe-S cluster assembly regulator [Deltaproteobacteria bacterium]|nr:SUF system Fe-S cluster assembly regulator [Deltaproteobacteria bacterium]
MLRISRLADYGVLLLLQVAKDSGSPMHTARDLADAVALPLPTVTKILKALAKGGILESHRGKTGGYTLNRPPAAVSVVDVITAIEGRPAFTQCTAVTEDPCVREASCPARPNWSRVHGTVLAALSRLTLADMGQVPGRRVPIAPVTLPAAPPRGVS